MSATRIAAPPASPAVPPVATGGPGASRHVALPQRRRWAQSAAAAFAVDLRSLAVFRVGLGLLVLSNAIVALGNVEMFLADAGFLPRTLLHERHWPSPLSWSLHALSGSVETQTVLLVLQMLAGLWMIAGWRTRLATFCCWVLVCSLETRNPVITNGADAMTRLLLFWAMFLPLGARWSLDACCGRGHPAGVGNSITSVASAALLLQVAFVYWFSVLCKTHQCWWGDGSALAQTLHLDLFARPAGIWLREHPLLCQGLTYGWLTVEAAGPLLAFLPFWRTRLRVAVVLLFVLFHLGIELTMNIGAFPLVMIVAWIAFLPAAVWESVERKLQISKSKLQGTFKPQGSRNKRPLHTQDLIPEHWSFLGVWNLKLDPYRRFLSRAASSFCLACLVFVFLWNVRGTNFSFWEQYFPRSVNPVAFALRLDQHWSMFAPRPSSEDGWFVLRAGMSDGSELDLLREGAPADFRKPALVSTTFKDARWQKLLTNVWLEEYRHLREPLGDAIARQWNTTHGGLNQVVAWQLWYMLERTLPDGSTADVVPCMLFERERFDMSRKCSLAQELRAGS